MFSEGTLLFQRLVPVWLWLMIKKKPKWFKERASYIGLLLAKGSREDINKSNR